ncbi:hypothetical protein GCM10007908_01480 [Rhizobium albus]|nr:hypothetical protein GCM10007908_01480 [Rhizobium albus]
MHEDDGEDGQRKIGIQQARESRVQIDCKSDRDKKSNHGHQPYDKFMTIWHGEKRKARLFLDLFGRKPELSPRDPQKVIVPQFGSSK